MEALKKQAAVLAISGIAFLVGIISTVMSQDQKQLLALGGKYYCSAPEPIRMNIREGANKTLREEGIEVLINCNYVPPQETKE